MKRIIVTGAGGSAANNFIESLHMSGEKMYLIGTDVNVWHLELPDVDKKYILPRVDSLEYLDKLNHLIEKEDVGFVHPQPDVEVNLISENREKINALTFLPTKGTIRICQDKMRLNEVLEKNNVPIPQSFHIKGEGDVDEALDSLMEKSDRVWLRAIRGAGSKASLPIKKSSHGKMWVDYWITMRGLSYEDFMISEFLPGREFAFQSIWKDGKLITSQARERLEYVFGNLTPSGQTSSPSVAKTVHRSDVNKIATKAILAVDKKASGVFCVDMKENSEGVPCITEINSGRFFTTNNFFSTAGVNMPYLYTKLAYGEDIPKTPKYNPIPENWYWIRLIDCGHILIRGENWTSTRV